MNIAKYIDHTILKRDAISSEIEKICKEAKEYGFKSVCTHPIWTEKIKEELKGSDVLTCIVVGFPFGTNTTKSKIYEGLDAIERGAQELDYVVNVSKVHERDTEYLENELNEIRTATKGTTIKLIIETGLLSDEEKVYISKLAIAAKWDFIKTSTGINTTGATIEDVKLMKEIAGEDYQVKASGGVKTLEDAKNLIEAGATRIGTSNGTLIMDGLEVTEGY